ncbi:hypothetical protein JG687_00012507 [Phytophthora cactorum]|uniref:RNase H type-1 domain-containing protein n=1 Tax=Phytophthora cactorum TaxID=29920 RepID=A0A8T1U683_9STRA|nr:hypothetical protein JG687_00012507 [Phytophthora cactorum]
MALVSLTITNNQAEKVPLYHGLQACMQHRWSPLHVIGDSALIIIQHSKRRAPIAVHLKTI